MNQQIQPLDQMLRELQTLEFAGVKDQFFRVMKLNSFKKGRVLLDIDEVNDMIYFVRKGVIRSYYAKNLEGIYITSRLAAEGDLACVAESFFSQRPSDEAMEVLEDTEVYTISYQDYRRLISESHDVARLTIQLLEQRLTNFGERVKIFKFLSVEQRVAYYLSLSTSLFGRIPDQYIATYLGTTPATFSRCMKNLRKQAAVLK